MAVQNKLPTNGTLRRKVILKALIFWLISKANKTVSRLPCLPETFCQVRVPYFVWKNLSTILRRWPCLAYLASYLFLSGIKDLMQLLKSYLTCFRHVSNIFSDVRSGMPFDNAFILTSYLTMILTSDCLLLPWACVCGPGLPELAVWWCKMLRKNHHAMSIPSYWKNP